MYPMISGLDELNQANALVESCKAELRAENIPFDDRLEIGAMIEIPSAVMVADTLAKRVKFFSLGTNDLIQYSLAADRLNERIAHLYEPTHPAILSLIKLTVEAGHRNGIWVGFADGWGPDIGALLLGGCGRAERQPASVPQLKFLIRRLKLSKPKSLLNGR